MYFRRRDLLTGTAFLLLSKAACATTISHELPWAPNSENPPAPVRPGGWQFFTFPEAQAVEALADRIIPSDAQTPGGKDSGCAVFIDRQLAGPYGHGDGLYNSPPFRDGIKQQGPQSKDAPAQKYRTALAALDRACKANYLGRAFAELPDDNKDQVLKGLESGDIKLEGADGKAFMEQLVKDVQMGFFADPLYGGNRDMVGWKHIGYPGARYNYLDWIDRHNERFPLPPVSIMGRADWTPKAH